MAPAVKIDVPDFSRYGADLLVLETLLGKPPRNFSRFSQMDKSDESGIAVLEDGRIYLCLFLDDEGPDENDLTDLELIQTSYDAPPKWTVSVQFRYDPGKYELSCGLPTPVHQFSSEYGSGLITGVKYMLARPQGFLLGFYVDAPINPEGQMITIAVTVYGTETLPIEPNLLSKILDYCLPHANALVKERFPHAASAK